MTMEVLPANGATPGVVATSGQGGGGQGNGGLGGSGPGGNGQGNGRRRDWRHLRDMGIAVLAWLAVIGIVFWGLAHVIGSLLLFIVAAILAYALAPAVTHLQRFMPRGVAITLVYLGILTTLSGLIYLIVITAIGQVSMLLADVQSLLAVGPNGQESPLLAIFKSVGLSDEQVQRAGQQMLAQVQGLTGDAVSIAAGVVDALVRTVLVGVLSIYLLKDGPKVVGWLRNNTPIAQRPRIVFFVDTLDTVVGGYIRGQLTLSALIGVLVGGGMWAFHVPYAVFLGVLAFVLEFIPIVGVFISGGICVVLALTQGVPVALLVLIYFVGVHFVEGDVVGPRIMSKAVGLHPALSILALLAGSELFGIWGALFAAPMAGLIQAVIRTFWLEWRASHPEQFPTGYTVTPDVRVIPVVHTEAPPPATVEPFVTPEPPAPLNGDQAGEPSDLAAHADPPAKPLSAPPGPPSPLVSPVLVSSVVDAAAETEEELPADAPVETLAELATEPLPPATPEPADVDAAADGRSSGEDDPPDVAPLQPVASDADGDAQVESSPARAEVADLLPDVAARALGLETPRPAAGSIYDRFGALEPLPLLCETDGTSAADGSTSDDAAGDHERAATGEPGATGEPSPAE